MCHELYGLISVVDNLKFLQTDIVLFIEQGPFVYQLIYLGGISSDQVICVNCTCFFRRVDGKAGLLG